MIANKFVILLFVVAVAAAAVFVVFIMIMTVIAVAAAVVPVLAYRCTVHYTLFFTYAQFFVFSIQSNWIWLLFFSCVFLRMSSMFFALSFSFLSSIYCSWSQSPSHHAHILFIRLLIVVTDKTDSWGNHDAISRSQRKECDDRWFYCCYRWIWFTTYFDRKTIYTWTIKQ